MLNIIGKKIFTIYAENFCLSKPVVYPGVLSSSKVYQCNSFLISIKTYLPALEIMLSIANALIIYLLASSATDFCKQFGPR